MQIKGKHFVMRLLEYFSPDHIHRRAIVSLQLDTQFVTDNLQSLTP